MTDIQTEARELCDRLADAAEGDRNDGDRASIYDRYGSPGEHLAGPLYSLCDQVRRSYPHAVVALLKEFLDD